MAVEATHLHLFPPQVIQGNFVDPMMTQGKTDSFYNNGNQQMRYSGVPITLPMTNYNLYQPAAVCDSVQAKTSVNTDSGLTYNIPAAAPRKRSRESMMNHQLYSAPLNNFHMSPHNNNNNNCNISQLPSFVGDHFLPQIQQHQLEIDAIISQHTKKMRLELEERQKQQTRQLAAAIGEGVMKKLKEKDEQIQRMSKLNFLLQERVKSLFVENQLWRDVAQSNEATANSLRTNLEQVLAHVGGGEERVSALEEEAESCCGSSAHGMEEKEIISYNNNNNDNKLCKRCGERESCVLLLPCRHLCLCNVCGSGSQKLQTCPQCNSSMNATLHVNMMMMSS